MLKLSRPVIIIDITVTIDEMIGNAKHIKNVAYAEAVAPLPKQVRSRTFVIARIIKGWDSNSKFSSIPTKEK